MNLLQAKRWSRQAEADLVAAKDSEKLGHYEWSCFQAQQSAEKALKAFLYLKGLRALVTHSAKDLVDECAEYEKEFEALEDEGRFLDMFYIPTRYPNGLPGENTPADFYRQGDAQKCINCAELILEKVRKFIKG